AAAQSRAAARGVARCTRASDDGAASGPRTASGSSARSCAAGASAARSWQCPDGHLRAPAGAQGARARYAAAIVIRRARAQNGDGASVEAPSCVLAFSMRASAAGRGLRSAEDARRALLLFLLLALLGVGRDDDLLPRRQLAPVERGLDFLGVERL